MGTSKFYLCPTGKNTDWSGSKAEKLYASVFNADYLSDNPFGSLNSLTILDFFSTLPPLAFHSDSWQAHINYPSSYTSVCMVGI